MTKSMTGFGAHSIQIKKTIVSVEVRTVNHRFLDFTPKIPRSLLFLEDKIKRMIQSYFNRGRVEVYINIEGNGFVVKHLQTDWELMDQYIEQMNKAKKRYELSGDVSVSLLTSVPDLLSIQEIENQPSDLQEYILDCTKMACEQVLLRRKEEGNYLLNDMKDRIKTIRNMVLLLEGRRKEVVEEYKARINSRIVEYIDEDVMVDRNRMHQEIALLAEKGDISEEITRLHSHLDHFTELITKSEPIGRKLDFILQEMHRETNTIGSKSTDSKIGEWTVNLKSNLEKLKEQVQNIE